VRLREKERFKYHWTRVFDDLDASTPRRPPKPCSKESLTFSLLILIQISMSVYKLTENDEYERRHPAIAVELMCFIYGLITLLQRRVLCGTE
jgi:hypothetical protein